MTKRRPIAERLFAQGGHRGGQDLSPDILHKSDVGGVRARSDERDAVVDAAGEILARRGSRGRTRASTV